jgi:hypothetical protein
VILLWVPINLWWVPNLSQLGSGQTNFSLNVMWGIFEMRVPFLSALCGLVLFSVGCGGPVGPVDPQAQVSGTVTNNGKPVTLGSMVVFYNSEKGLTLTGLLDSLGKYSLTAADPKIGVPAGRWAVSVKAPTTPVLEMGNSADYTKMMQGGGAKSVAASKPATASDIPEKFTDAKTSGLVFEVKAGANDFSFDLSKL